MLKVKAGKILEGRYLMSKNLALSKLVWFKSTVVKFSRVGI